ncbi:MAG: Holliday junction branch migration DNA helicase RuvB [Geminicoccaceae bacterium]
MDHVLFAGPRARQDDRSADRGGELGVGFRAASGPIIQRAGDLAALLTGHHGRATRALHRRDPPPRPGQEVLYPAMEDFQLDLMIGEGPAARSVRIDLAPFTLVGATTRTGLLTTPLRDRFGILARMEFYGQAELLEIVERGARLLRLGLTGEGAAEIARRSRGTPRVATRLLRRVRDFATVEQPDGGHPVDRAEADAALQRLAVDRLGLDALDRRYLNAIAVHYGGGPVGVETLAAALSEQRDTLEETVEPYLLQQGLLQRTPRGRLLTQASWRHLGLAMPASAVAQAELFAGPGAGPGEDGEGGP